MPVLDLSTLMESEEHTREIYEALKTFFETETIITNDKGKITERYVNVDGKTQLSRKDVINLTSIEIIIGMFEKTMDYIPLPLSILLERYKVNAISLDRQGRKEFVEILKGLFSKEAEEDKRKRGMNMDTLLGRGR